MIITEIPLYQKIILIILFIVWVVSNIFSLIIYSPIPQFLYLVLSLIIPITVSSFVTLKNAKINISVIYSISTTFILFVTLMIITFFFPIPPIAVYGSISPAIMQGKILASNFSIFGILVIINPLLSLIISYIIKNFFGSAILK